MAVTSDSFSTQSTTSDPFALNPTNAVSAGFSEGQSVNNVPFISQYRPAGAENGYANGAANCGPASMAMIARSMGFGKGMTDAQLITFLGQAGDTNAEGTSVAGIVAMAQAMGSFAQMKAGSDVSWVAEQLQAGKKVVANGDYYAMPPHQDESRTSGHYLDVVGMDKTGNFLVQDPADGNAKTLTPEQLQHFMSSNTNGGYAVAIG